MAGFTQEQYKKASQVDLIDYLTANGYKIKKVGTNEYTLEEHDSMRINVNKNTFFWNSKNLGGSTIQFLQYYEGKSLVDAIKILNGEQIEKTIKPKYIPKIEEKGNLILPEKNEDNKRAIAYLTKSRKLDFEIVNSLIKSGNIYESKDKHNVVFLGKDNEGVPRYAMQRSSLTESSFKGDCKNSDKDFGFRIDAQNSCNKVCVFESAIDLITHATVSKHLGKDWKDINRVSLGCLSFKSMDNFLKDNENIKEIILFLDNDKSGIENALKFYKNYGNDYKINIISVKNKDLNETWQDYLKDKEQDNAIKFSSYIKFLDKPFLEPKLKDDKVLKEYIRKITTKDIKDDVINEFFENKLIALSEDDKAILFIKNDNGENIGAYELDIFNKEYDKLRLIENSEKEPLFFEKEKSNFLLVTNNILDMLALKKHFNILLVKNLDNLESLEKIFNEKITHISFMPYVDSNIFEKVKKMEERYPFKSFKIEDYEKNELANNVLKDEYKVKFSKPELGNNEELYSHLLIHSNIPKNKILELFKNNIIYQDTNRNMIVLVKDEKENDVGGYSINIYGDKEIKTLENTDIDAIKNEKTSNIIKYIEKSCYINQIEEIEVVENLEI